MRLGNVWGGGDWIQRGKKGAHKNEERMDRTHAGSSPCTSTVVLIAVVISSREVYGKQTLRMALKREMKAAAARAEDRQVNHALQVGVLHGNENATNRLWCLVRSSISRQLFCTSSGSKPTWPIKLTRTSYRSSSSLHVARRGSVSYVDASCPLARFVHHDAPLVSELPEPPPHHVHQSVDLILWPREVLDGESVYAHALDVEPQACLEDLSLSAPRQPTPNTFTPSPSRPDSPSAGSQTPVNAPRRPSALAGAQTGGCRP